MHEGFPYYSPELDRTAPEDERRGIEDVIVLLQNPEFLEEIDNGNVTFAMIRPNVGPEANVQALPDAEAAERIEEMVEGLGVMAKFSFTFSVEDAAEFYDGDPRESMLRNTNPRDPLTYDTRWPEFRDAMASGPVTALLLHDPDGEAIEKWRAHLGHWNIDKYRDPATIRGKFGVNQFNNLVHGSDSSESVHRELQLVSRILTRELERHEDITG